MKPGGLPRGGQSGALGSVIMGSPGVGLLSGYCAETMESPHSDLAPATKKRRVSRRARTVLPLPDYAGALICDQADDLKTERKLTQLGDVAGAPSAGRPCLRGPLRSAGVQRGFGKWGGVTS